MHDPEGFVFRRPASYKRGIWIGDWRKVWRKAFAACEAERGSDGEGRTWAEWAVRDLNL